jgi:hypothetical protein
MCVLYGIYDASQAVHIKVSYSLKYIKLASKCFDTLFLCQLFVNMAQYVRTLMRENPFRGPLEGVGPENRDYFGP